MKLGCWAKSLGNCGGKLSGEHVVTEALWTGPSVEVSGGPWGEAPKHIGLGSLKTKVLCKHHNSVLSPVDTAGAEAFATLLKFYAVTERRRALVAAGRPVAPLMLHGFEIDGPLLERWFLKTAVNICLLLSGYPLWDYGAARGEPHHELVRFAFGLTPFRYPFGLYASARKGDTIKPAEAVIAEPFWSDEGGISGMSFSFAGLRFVMHMTDAAIEGIRSGETGDVERSRGDLHYHARKIMSDVAGHPSHFLVFRWPAALFTHFAD